MLRGCVLGWVVGSFVGEFRYKFGWVGSGSRVGLQQEIDSSAVGIPKAEPSVQ